MPTRLPPDPPKRMLVGLTGGIGSGKSAVANLLAAHGARIIDADVVAREVVARGTNGLAEIVAHFGPDVLGEDGELDRARLGQFVFADPDARQRLNSIVHPLVSARTESLVAEGRESDVVVYDVPLLVEESVHERQTFDLILVVEAPEDERIRRLVRDRGMTEAQVRARISAQASDEQRRAVADAVIVNDGSLDNLSDAVDKLWQTRIAATRS